MHSTDGSVSGDFDVLVVGDDPGLAQVFAGQDAFARGLRARVVADAGTALKAAAVPAPDIVLIDVRRAGFDAFGVCRELRAASTTSTVPIVLLGEFVTAADLARARESGASDVIPLPLAPALLLERIEMQLDLQLERRARQRAQADARAERVAAGEFLASMNYEIRTPMTAILGMSHLALQSGLDPRQRNYIEKVARSAELLLGTLNDMLDFSSIGAGKLELQHGAFRLLDVVDNVARLVGLKADEKRLELLFELAPDLPRDLIGDAARLGQVLVSLGTNAVQRTERGEVIVGVECVDRFTTGARLRFSVSDTGATQDAQHQPPAPNTPEALGSAITRHLVTLMGGALQTTRDAAAGNTTQFTASFELPASDAVAAASVEWIAANGTRVLVVGDNANARRILSAMCSRLGMDAETAIDGWDALRKSAMAVHAREPYALVLCDARMPGMDGVECARQMKQGVVAPPTILMTGAMDRDALVRRLELQELQVRAVLAKPVLPHALREAVKLALQREPQPAGATRGSASTRAVGLRGARILLVEDNAIIQELALELLSSAGIVVSLAENGQAALERLAKQTFDGVLMDCQMPVMNGFEATRALRAIPHLKNLPVIALTADVLDADRDHVVQAGMNDHIAKPFDVDQMFATLARWVHAPAAPEPAPPAPAAMPDDDPLAHLPGIDARVGRSSTMSNDKLYRRLLGMFREGQRDFASQFRAARSAGDRATAMRLAHNLRAVSGSLGAVSVQKSSSELERACAHEAPDAMIAELLDSVVADLDPVITGLGRLGPS